MSSEGKVVIVTGSGSGIGAATAVLLASRGMKLVLAGRRENMLEAVADHIRAQGGDAIIFPGDMSVAADARGMVQAAIDQYGALHCAVNAAGAAAVGSTVDSDEALYNDVMDANVKTAWLSMKYEIPAIIAAGGGAIVNVSSTVGLTGAPHGSIYSASKHAVIGLTKSAALEYADKNVRINAICPGTVQTEQFAGIVSKAMPGVSTDDAAALLGSKIPLGRLALAEEIANGIAWLLSPGASFATGTILSVDGGKSAG